MKRSTRGDAAIRKQQSAKRVEELEREKQALQKEVEELRHKFGAPSVTSIGGSANVEEGYLGKLNNLESQVLELRKKLEGQSLLLKQKQKSDEAAKRLQDEICKIKSQKVELHRKIKQESVQFRSWKALQEKEILQLRKDGRRTEYEMHKLLDLNQRLKMVLKRKTEETSVATKLLEELLKSRKASTCSDNANDPRLQAIEHQVKVTEKLNEVRSQCERQMEKRVRMAEEAAKFKEEADMQIQKNLCFLLQDKEAECREKDSELSDLNKKVVELSSLVQQLKMRNEGSRHKEKSEEPGTSIILDSSGSGVEMLDIVRFESEHSGLDMVNSENTESGEGPVEKRGSQSGNCSFTEGTVTMTGKAASAACCSCSKKSLCKTNKCQCLASGGICGVSCGCASTKCTNRETVLVKELKSSPRSEITAEQDDDCIIKPKPLYDIGNTQIISNAAKPNQRKMRSSRQFSWLP